MPPVCAAPASLPPYTRIAPLSPASYALQCTLSAAVHAKLREVQDLLGPRVHPGDMSQVLELALDALLKQLARTRKAAIQRPEGGVTAEPGLAAQTEPAGAEPPLVAVSRDPRHIPAHIRRAVWARDGDCCQFESASGRRCESRSGLELDHVRPVAVGGASTLDNLRLLRRAHNQLEGERRLGRAFMHTRRAG